MVTFETGKSFRIEDLIKIMELLRSPEGCPWDRVQTHQSIRQNMLEEAYEAADAIDRMDMDNLKEELGDVLFAAVCVGRFLEADPEDALHAACGKFALRFRKMEELAAQRGQTLDKLGEGEQLSLWNEAKRALD